MGSSTIVYLDPQADCSQNSWKTSQIFSMPAPLSDVLLKDILIPWRRDRKKNAQYYRGRSFYLGEEAKGPNQRPSAFIPRLVCGRVRNSGLKSAAKLLGMKTSLFEIDWSNFIDLVTVFHAILTGRQTREKLQWLYENLMSNNFRRTPVLKKNMTCKLKLHF